MWRRGEASPRKVDIQAISHISSVPGPSWWSYLWPVSTLPASDLATEPLVEEVELLDREPPCFMIEVGEDLQQWRHDEAGPGHLQLLTSPARPPLCCSAVCWAAASGATRTEAALWGGGGEGSGEAECVTCPGRGGRPRPGLPLLGAAGGRGAQQPGPGARRGAGAGHGAGPRGAATWRVSQLSRVTVSRVTRAPSCRGLPGADHGY